MKTEKGLHVRRCRVFTKNIGEDQKKRSSLFVMKPLIFSEALGFSLPSLLVNPALPGACYPGKTLKIYMLRMAILALFE